MFRPPAPAAGGRFAGALSRLCTMGPACGREPGSGVRSVAPGTRSRTHAPARGARLPPLVAGKRRGRATTLRLSGVGRWVAVPAPKLDGVADELGRATTVTLTVFGGGSHCARPGTHLSPRVHRLRCRRARGCARGATPPREGRAVAVPLRGGGLTRAARQ